MEKPSCKIHGVFHSVELLIMVPLVDTLLGIIMLGEGGFVVIMHVLIILL
jgi:hypothetical protein